MHHFVYLLSASKSQQEDTRIVFLAQPDVRFCYCLTVKRADAQPLVERKKQFECLPVEIQQKFERQSLGQSQRA